jgi:hypothetical protein
MAAIDIFNNNTFSMTSITEALNNVPFQPTRLGEMNIFMPKPVRTTSVSVEEKNGALSLISTTPRGAPLDEKAREKRKIRDFRTVRIAKHDRLTADEIQGIRAFGSESELMQVVDEVNLRMNGPSGLMRDVELTWENMRLGAVQGIVVDADGTTVINNWFTEFGINQATEINFDLAASSPASGAVRKVCQQVIRQMMKAASGAWIPGRTYVHCLCGDAFWDDLTAHAEVRQTYLNTQQAAELRGGNAYQSFQYGGITFENYRGTDDGSTVAIHTDKAKFFPVNSNAFQVAYSPAETFDYVNTPGQPVYGMVLPDDKRNAFVDLEVYSYPLFMCTRPAMLQRAKRTA